MEKATLRTYLDEKNNILFHFLSASKLRDSLRDLYRLNDMDANRLGEYLYALLPLIGLLKNQEGIGVYLNNTDKSFYFNLEADFLGKFRTMFVPKNHSLPEEINGQARLVKILPDKKQYTSVIDLKNATPEMIANELLMHSYQFQGALRTDGNTGTGLLGMKLPFLGGQKISTSPSQQNEQWNNFMNKNISEMPDILTNSCTLLATKEIYFACRCQRDNFITGLLTLSKEDLKEIFNDKDTVHLQCDYCLADYLIEESEILAQ